MRILTCICLAALVLLAAGCTTGGGPGGGGAAFDFDPDGTWRDTIEIFTEVAWTNDGRSAESVQYPGGTRVLTVTPTGPRSFTATLDMLDDQGERYTESWVGAFTSPTQYTLTHTSRWYDAGGNVTLTEGPYDATFEKIS